jgi:hypothetical protein
MDGLRRSRPGFRADGGGAAPRLALSSPRGYAMGAGLPMFAYGGQYISSRVRQLGVYSRRLQQGFGVVALTAIAMYVYDTLITVWLCRSLSEHTHVFVWLSGR